MVTQMSHAHVLYNMTVGLFDCNHVFVHMHFYFVHGAVDATCIAYFEYCKQCYTQWTQVKIGHDW